MDRPSRTSDTSPKFKVEPDDAPTRHQMHSIAQHLIFVFQAHGALVSAIQALSEKIPFGEADCEAVWRSARRNLPHKKAARGATVPTAAYRRDAVGRVVIEDGLGRMGSQSGANELLLLLAFVSRVRLVLSRSLQTCEGFARALDLYRNLQTGVAGILKRKVLDRLCELNAPGLKWLKIGDSATTNGQRLGNSTLAEALKSKTEFTEQEWDAFGVQDLHVDHFVESGGSCFKPAAFVLESQIDHALQTVVDLALRTTAAFEIMLEDASAEVTVSKLEEMLQGAGMSQDQAHQLIQIIDANHDKNISMQEFTLAPFDPIVRVLADMTLASSSKDADFWVPMLDLKCAVMRSSVAGYSKTREAIEELVYPS